MKTERTIFTAKEKGSELLKITPNQEKWRTPEQMQLLNIYYDFLAMETEPSLQQCSEVENAVERLGFISIVTHAIDLSIQPALCNIRKEIFCRVTPKIEIRAMEDMIEYLMILIKNKQENQNIKKSLKSIEESTTEV